MALIRFLKAVLEVVPVLMEVVVLFNFIILIHELGHFLAARWRGMVVDRFSIWFGKPLLQKRVGKVVFSLGSIPFGGFVSLPQMAPMEFLEGRVLDTGEPMRPASATDKILVAAAGPAFSFLLAFVFAAVVWVVGVPTSEPDPTAMVGYIDPDSPAAKADILPGDRILAVDGHPVSRFLGTGDSVGWQIAVGESPTVHLDYERNGQRKTVEIAPSKETVKGWRRDSIRQLHIEPAERAVIDRVISPGPAQRAGLQPNDRLVSLNGQPLFHPLNVVDFLRTNGVRPVIIGVERQGKRLELTATPEVPIQGEQSRQPRLGIGWSQTGMTVITHPLPWNQVGEVLENMYNTIRALVSPRTEIKVQQLSGPVGILHHYFTLFESDHAMRLVLWFSVMLNINLAIMNLLPIPMLDGGHIVLSLAELVRRRPLSEPIVRWVQTCGAVVVIGFILYVTSFDVFEFGGRLAKPIHAPPEEMIFSPGSATGAAPASPAEKASGH